MHIHIMANMTGKLPSGFSYSLQNVTLETFLLHYASDAELLPTIGNKVHHETGFLCKHKIA